MKRVCLGMKGEANLFNNIKTSELNRATEVFKILGGSTPRDSASGGSTKTHKLNKSRILPTRHATTREKILPVLQIGESILIYIDKSQVLVKPTIRAEDVSIFDGM